MVRKKAYFLSYTTICNDIFNIIKNNNEVSAFVGGILLEMKEVIHCKDDNILNVERLTKHVNNFKNIFTPMDKESLIALKESTKYQTRNHLKEKKVSLNKIKKAKTNQELLKQKKLIHVNFVMN